MKIENRILLSIQRRPGAVLLRREVADLGSKSQVSKSLKALQSKGVIERVGKGIYAKLTKDSTTGAVGLSASAEDIAIEIFQKLKVVVRSGVSDTPSNDSLTLDTGSRRIKRRLSIGGKLVVYTHQRSNKRTFSLTSPLQIPTEGVSKFVARLARKHHITYVRTVGDEWAETVTRLAGDEVRSDATGNLLVALKRAHKLTDRDMTILLINHQREQSRVRSL